MYGDVRDTPGIVRRQKALSLAVPMVKQHDGKSKKEKKERKKGRMCPHECDIVPLDWFVHHDNWAEAAWTAGEPPGFLAQHNEERHGCLNLCDIPVVSGSNPWISMNWLGPSRSGSQKKCLTLVRGAHSPPWPPLTCVQPLGAFKRRGLILQG